MGEATYVYGIDVVPLFIAAALFVACGGAWALVVAIARLFGIGIQEGVGG